MTRQSETGSDAAELAALRDRVHALEQELAAVQVIRDRARFFELALDLQCIAGLDGYFRDLSPAWTRTLGHTREALLAEPFLNFVHPDDRDATLAAVADLGDGQKVVSFTNRYRRADGSYAVIEWNSIPSVERGLIYAAARDVTERHAAEETVRRHESALLEVSTPLIPITEDVLVAPLVGVVDAQRAERLLAALLDGIAARRTRVAILDITGVGVVDETVAATLVKVARAAQLLGARVMLTGIRPEVARTLVGLGTDLAGISTYGTLQDGIRAAMQGGLGGF